MFAFVVFDLFPSVLSPEISWKNVFEVTYLCGVVHEGVAR